MQERRPALGKGLSALIPEAPAASRPGVLEVDVDQIVPNDRQPRVQIDDARLGELAKSIRENGVIQPILVQPFGVNYRIIAGERRWRAAQMAGLLRIPVVVRQLAVDADRELLQLALVENIQRQELNPMEEAAAYQRLADDFGLSHEQIGAAVGKDRSSVANITRLLKLPEEVRASVAAGALATGHAKALLALPDESSVRQAARDVIARGLSVRDTESLVKRMASPPRAKAVGSPEMGTDVHTRAAEDRLRFTFGTKVRIVRRGHGGAIEISFASEAELNRLYELLTSR